MLRAAVNRTAVLPAGLLLLTTTAVLALLAAGCEEKEQQRIYDQDEIERYLYEATDARGLFRVEDLIPADTFELPWEPGVRYVQRMDSTERVITMLLSQIDKPHKVETLPYFARTGEVIIDDFLYLTVTRITDTDTTAEAETRAINRYAYFVKQGDDSQRFSGWKLYGYNGGYSVMDFNAYSYVTMQPQGGATRLAGADAYQRFDYLWVDTIYDEQNAVYKDTVYAASTGQRYIKVEEFAEIGLGDSLYFESEWDRQYHHLIAARTDAGYEVIPMEPVDATQKSGTVHTAAVNPEVWNCLSIQEWIRRQIPNSNDFTVRWAVWTVPYRVPQ